MKISTYVNPAMSCDNRFEARIQVKAHLLAWTKEIILCDWLKSLGHDDLLAVLAIIRSEADLIASVAFIEEEEEEDDNTYYL